MERQKTYKILTLLLLMQWAFVQILSQYPSFVEKYYSNGLYLYISKFLRLIFGWLPFSFGDLMYITLIVIILYSIFKLFRKRKITLKTSFFKIGALASILFFVFNLNWGLNYLRPSLSSHLKIDNKPYTDEELITFTKKLIHKTNQIHYSITNDDTILIQKNISKKEIREYSFEAYKQLATVYPQFKHQTSSLKNSLFSVPLTYMGFAGYLNPVTNEAQVNYLIPKNSYPATVCHELAHQIGIAPESEANFVSYLATKHSKNPFFNYAGSTMALRYCLADIYRKQPAQFELLKKELNKGILKDLKESQEFWQSYQNWSEKYFKLFYDSFLKANKQKDGIKGYSKMVTLLINYYNIEEHQL